MTGGTVRPYVGNVGDGGRLGSLVASYYRVTADRRFWARFMELFLGRNEVVRKHFDQVPRQQRRPLLQRSLTVLFQHATQVPGAERVLERLSDGNSPERVVIPESLYGLWLVSLMQAVGECDPEFSDQLENQWRHAMEGEVAYVLRSLHSTHAPDSPPLRERRLGATPSLSARLD